MYHIHDFDNIYLHIRPLHASCCSTFAYQKDLIKDGGKRHVVLIGPTGGTRSNITSHWDIGLLENINITPGYYTCDWPSIPLLSWIIFIHEIHDIHEIHGIHDIYKIHGVHEIHDIHETETPKTMKKRIGFYSF